MKTAKELMKEVEEKGLGDRFADMQQKSAPNIDASLTGKIIEVLFKYYDDDSEPMFVWTNGEVTGVQEPRKGKRGGKGKKNSTSTKAAANDIVIVKWDTEYLGIDKETGKQEPDTTSHQLIVSKWNKHGPGAWRFILGEDKCD